MNNNPMSVQAAIEQRASCRSFTDEPVSQADLEQCLAAARLAPSACNGQPWRFVVVQSEAGLQEIRGAVQQMGMNPFVKQVPCLVVVVEETTSLLARFGARMKQQDYTQIDLGFAAAHFCLQATELGLGTCVLGWFDEAKIQRYLGLPEGKRIRLVLAVGHPKEEINRTTSRKTMDQIREYR